MRFELIIKLIGHIIWPIILLIFLFTHRKTISKLFESMKRLKFADVEAEFDRREEIFADEEVSPLSDEVDGLEERIKQLESELAGLQKKSVTKNEKLDEQVVKNKVIDALENGMRRWRSIHRLAIISGSDEKQVLEILQNEESVTLGQGKSGRQIAKMKNR